MNDGAARVTFTRHDDGRLTYEVDDPTASGWTRLALELLPGIVADHNALADLRAKVVALEMVREGGLIRRGDVLALIDGAS